MTYFEAQVEIKSEQDNGKIKTIKERYLVDALSVTEAEAKVNGTFKESSNVEFEVKAVKQSSIVDVIS